MPRINLLPWREAERKRKRQEFGVGAVGALILAGVLALAVNWQMSAAIDAQNDRNQYLKNQIAELDKQITEILALEEQKERLKARIQVIEQLERSRPEIVHVMDQLVRTIPDGVYLTSVKQTDRKLQLKGVAQSSTRVAAYMRNIDSSEWLADPSLDILETKGSTDAGSEFTLNAVQENPQVVQSADSGPAAGPSRAGRGAAK
ncbi:MAG TPA: PilN domain-containing protein [Steroidobacteraceae bacterium]|jgi:type IV pilus assembly protein PilN|nr:PilN domain-containing protein [Steroidobacteraceae bacterium]